MIKVKHVTKHGYEYYFSEEGGILIQREEGMTPFGNPLNMRWVLRECYYGPFGKSLGKMIDFDQYRHDLFERNEIIVDKE